MLISPPKVRFFIDFLYSHSQCLFPCRAVSIIKKLINPDKLQTVDKLRIS